VGYDLTKCPLCLKAANGLALGPLDQIFKFECVRCGAYQITDEAVACLQDAQMIRDLFKISAYTRERVISRKPLITIVSSNHNIAATIGAAVDLQTIISQFPNTISGRLDRVLRNILAASPFPGARFQFNLENDYPVFLAENPEACWFIGKALETDGLISTNNTIGHVNGSLTVEGWDRLSKEEQGRSPADSKQVFVAMSFDPSLDNAFKEGMEKAIGGIGYKALRVDLKEHNDKICDVIVAEIRRSNFVVADFTMHKAGVYFEAGFALGLGIPVIWTCREDQLTQTHFDTRQYNHVVWKDEGDLFEKLQRRIEATISVS
jgi:nucleoside 2-deoxyribosyltransferase/Zn ribbon nucleic-acid-binding protein